MDAAGRIETALELALATARDGCPPRLGGALRDAVIPGGARLRPRLTLAVAFACADDQPATADAAAAAIELLHCASLVHDDMPCFDDAALRRGRPSIHSAYGENVALLTGDALIVLAFSELARRVSDPVRLRRLIGIVADAVGAPNGIVAGQAQECEPSIGLSDYHRRKTGALISGATMAGAAAAGFEPEPWRALGMAIGEAYQVADDIRDLVCEPAELGKPVGRDAALGRPSATREFGMAGAMDRLRVLVARAVEVVPVCPGDALLKAMILRETRKFLPAELAAEAA
ncbi:polyprenyl synthetase family protein [Prosthecomicrobium hirschii]|uniref:polyprenyl synthetase family protein n=1 Tax=Prosthecodimorpha hirschii TaxID=665126 RepID=UPI00221FFA6B|nr:polyprenyl synthetase family protein [Prosthecomicrobium hirschii]MCW1842505.1 polyprenyl synthetase family protein [Prosthecomicrobium hirschii]